VIIFVIFLCRGIDGASAETVYEVSNDFIRITDGNNSHTCKLDERPLYAVESYDETAIIISERGYIKRQQLNNCEDSIVHVSSIPEGVGFLSDINIGKDIYISLDLIGVRPPRYLATIARIGSDNSLVSIHGVYKRRVGISRLRKYGFPSLGQAGASTISIDGAYVAPNGVIDCSDVAYPGVWDIRRNGRVTTDEKSCAKLFMKHGEN
jgi:hypothetical protein